MVKGIRAYVCMSISYTIERVEMEAVLKMTVKNIYALIVEAAILINHCEFDIRESPRMHTPLWLEQHLLSTSESGIRVLAKPRARGDRWIRRICRNAGCGRRTSIAVRAFSGSC